MASKFCFEAEAPGDIQVTKVFTKEDPPPEHDRLIPGIKRPLQIPNVDYEVPARVIYFYVDESMRSAYNVITFTDGTNETVYRWDVRLATRVGRLRPGTTCYWQQLRMGGEPGGGSTWRHGIRGLGSPAGQQFDIVDRWNPGPGGNVWTTQFWNTATVIGMSSPLACTVGNLDFFINGQLSLHRVDRSPGQGAVGFSNLAARGVHLVFVEPGAQFSRNNFCF